MTPRERIAKLEAMSDSIMDDNYIYKVKLETELAELREKNAKLEAVVEKFRFMAENLDLEGAYLVPRLRGRMFEILSEGGTH